jgi:hypothetical protein
VSQRTRFNLHHAQARATCARLGLDLVQPSAAASWAVLGSFRANVLNMMLRLIADDHQDGAKIDTRSAYILDAA